MAGRCYPGVEGGEGDEAEEELAAGLDADGGAVGGGERVDGLDDFLAQLGDRAERLLLDVVQEALDGADGRGRVGRPPDRLVEAGP